MMTTKLSAWCGGFIFFCVLNTCVYGADLDFSPSASPFSSFKDGHKSIGSGAARAIDVLLSKAGLKAAIDSVGLGSSSARKVEQVVALALKNLTGVENPSRSQLANGLRGINSGADGRLKRRLSVLLSESEKELSKEEFVELVNSLVYLAGRYGVDNSLALACSACVSSSLAKKGFRFTYDEIADERTSYILNRVIPRKPADVIRYIKKNLKNQKLVPQRLNYLKELPKEDEKIFALFLAIPAHGSPAQKELYEAIKLISRQPGNQGMINILDAENPHQLWRLFASDLNELELEGWSKVLRSVAEDASEKNEINKKAAFYRYLEAKVSTNPSLADRYKTIKSKNCFFK